MKKEIIYRTFDELLSAVQSDMKSTTQEGFIEPQDLIKVAQRINKELHVEKFTDKETLLNVSKYRVRLPLDLYMLNFAFIVYDTKVTYKANQGIQTEDVLVPVDATPQDLYNNLKELPENCKNEIVRITECGETYQIIQKIGVVEKTYKYLDRLIIEDNQLISPEFKKHLTQINESPYLSKNKAYIKNGWLYTEFEEGTVYLNYINNMEDDEGNLLVWDDPIVNEYYEYSFKVRILENMLIAGEQVGELYKLMDSKRRNARLEARNLRFTPGFDEIVKVHNTNRKVMYNKYYKMFSKF